MNHHGWAIEIGLSFELGLKPRAQPWDWQGWVWSLASLQMRSDKGLRGWRLVWVEAEASDEAEIGSRQQEQVGGGSPERTGTCQGPDVNQLNSSNWC